MWRKEVQREGNKIFIIINNMQSAYIKELAEREKCFLWKVINWKWKKISRGINENAKKWLFYPRKCSSENNKWKMNVKKEIISKNSRVQAASVVKKKPTKREGEWASVWQRLRLQIYIRCWLTPLYHIHTLALSSSQPYEFDVWACLYTLFILNDCEKVSLPFGIKRQQLQKYAHTNTHTHLRVHCIIILQNRNIMNDNSNNNS